VVCSGPQPLYYLVIMVSDQAGEWQVEDSKQA